MKDLKSYLIKKAEQEKPEDLDDKTVFYLFARIVKELYGTKGGTHIEPVSFKGGVLGVRTKSPLWANELWLERGSLCDRVNREIGEEVMKDLKIFH